MKRTYAIAGILAAVVLSGVAAYVALSVGHDDKFADCRTTKVAGGANVIGGPFTLIDETGKTVTDTDVITKPSLIYFGYTYCPDICPLDNARNAEAVDILARRGYDVTPIFISVDPARDTPAVLKEFTDYLHPKMIGLTGTPEQVKAASKAYRTFYQKQPSEDPDYYLINHSTFTYLVFPKTGFADFFRRDLTADQMADKVACFVDAQNG